EILEAWLRGWQMQPTAVANGLAAMDALWHGVASGQPYAVALVDAAMPDTEGVALAAKIRDRAELAPTRIVLLTAGGTPARGSADGHVSKPVAQDELLDVLARATSGAEMPAAAAPGPEVRPVVPLTILVAEDNELNLQLLRELLTRRGHTVQAAIDGKQA